ncbi:unnamed protein product [Bursaphelenchus xylophilus]|uniref:(pine wood nematode) hypothetical protein n=1 Tax=Bursaphelenchus xylophilus TaxID=6326 RepID=A0A1I7RM23_BURXY|nr:unnamed protein product [Bursaphelenchus xylophilus]CAG9118134.1 unnamed protein product [Bursaphelenchus xylophilus]
MVVLNGIQEEKELGITGYSVKWVLNKLEECCEDYVKAKDDRKVVDIEAVDVSEGKGYLSRVFVTTITFNDGDNYKIAMKVPTYSIIAEKIKEMGDVKNHNADESRANINMAHDIECDAVSFVSTFPNFPSPKVYFTQKTTAGQDCGLPGRNAPGVIIMKALDGASLGMARSVTPEQCLNFAADFATLQDYVAQSPESEWKGKFDSALHFGAGMFEACKAGLNRLKDEFPEELAEISDIFESLDWIKFSKYALKIRPAQLNATTYAHGDSWTNNVMFKKNPDGSVGNEALAYIDYQIGFEGSPLFDIARFLTLAADAEVRREVTERTLELYYETLTRLYGKRGQKVPFSFDEAKEMYDLCYVQETFELIVVAAFAENDAAVAPEVLEARSAKLKLRTRFAMSDALRIWKKRNYSRLCAQFNLFA